MSLLQNLSTGDYFRAGYIEAEICFPDPPNYYPYLNGIFSSLCHEPSPASAQPRNFHFYSLYSRDRGSEGITPTQVQVNPSSAPWI